MDRADHPTPTSPVGTVAQASATAQPGAPPAAPTPMQVPSAAGIPAIVPAADPAPAQPGALPAAPTPAQPGTPAPPPAQPGATVPVGAATPLGGPAAPPAAAVLPIHDVLVLDRAPWVFPETRGLRLQRCTSAVAFAGAVRTFRRGVIALAIPPGTSRDIGVVAQARAERAGVRVLLVDDAASPDQRLVALAQGFDDAVPASVGPREIAGRLAVLGDRTREETRDRLPVAPGRELDLTARALRRNGRLVHLRPMEFRLLEELARNPGRPIAREALLREVWGADGSSISRTVDVHMRWLRAKVEQDPEHPRHLLTVRGVGYQLEPAGEVGEVPEPP